MIDYRVVSRMSAMRVMVAAGLVVGAAGCSRIEPPVAGSRLRVYAADVTGAARVCDVSKVAPVAGAGSSASMKVINDGGWCGIPVHQDGPKPFDAGLLTKRSNHGTVLIHGVGDETRIDFTPDRGFAGSDDFAVKLIPSGATISVAVMVAAKGS